ncbi:hypothetical protein TgHK011_005365 [Trichoderma gracile]|nr:hypothetical protein TgHK011_005365 [Trichoderma gracile]
MCPGGADIPERNAAEETAAWQSVSNSPDLSLVLSSEASEQAIRMERSRGKPRPSVGPSGAMQVELGTEHLCLSTTLSFLSNWRSTACRRHDPRPSRRTNAITTPSAISQLLPWALVYRGYIHEPGLPRSSSRSRFNLWNMHMNVNRDMDLDKVMNRVRVKVTACRSPGGEAVASTSKTGTSAYTLLQHPLSRDPFLLSPLPLFSPWKGATTGM